MKYAAKITWPEKSPSWQHQGESGSAQAFAVEFATVEQLGMDSEFVVMEKEGGSPEIHFFRVVGCSPYRVAAAESRVAPAQTVDVKPASTVGADAPGKEEEAEGAGAISMGPVISLIIYMAKVAVVATASIAGLALLRKMIWG